MGRSICYGSPTDDKIPSSLPRNTKRQKTSPIIMYTTQADDDHFNCCSLLTPSLLETRQVYVRALYTLKSRHSLCLCLFLSVSISLYLSLCFVLCLFLSLYLSLCLFLSVCLSLCLSVSFFFPNSSLKISDDLFLVIYTYFSLFRISFQISRKIAPWLLSQCSIMPR